MMIPIVIVGVALQPTHTQIAALHSSVSHTRDVSRPNTFMRSQSLATSTCSAQRGVEARVWQQAGGASVCVLIVANHPPAPPLFGN